MSFGTFRRTVDENPDDDGVGEGDEVLRYEAEDGTAVYVYLTYDHGGYETDTWSGTPRRPREYAVSLSGVPAELGHELVGEDPMPHGTKEGARQEVIRLVEALVERGFGSY